MKKLTLGQAYKDCLRMWKWIAEQVEGGCIDDVCTLKYRWLEEKQKKYAIGSLSSNCFFCHYDMLKADIGDAACKYCPGRIVDKRFNCINTSYDHLAEPVKFYKKLLKLDEKRRRLNIRESR